jgi:hypothetical protein
VRVFNTTCSSASITSFVPKWRSFSFIFNWGNRKVAKAQVRQVEWVGDDSHVGFGKTLADEKQSVRQCFVLMQQPVLLSPKFEPSFHTFSCSHYESHTSMWTWLFGMPRQILCEQSLWGQRKWWACWRMASSGMLHHVARVRIGVSEELSAPFIRMTRIGELGTMLAVTSNRRTLRRNTKWEMMLEWNTELRMQRWVGGWVSSVGL